MTDKTEGTRIAARTLPLPGSISPEAQAVLRRLIGEDGMPVNAGYAMPDPADADAWLALKATAASHYARFAETIVGSLRSKLETATVGDTIIHIATPATENFAGAALIDLHGGAFVFGGGEACAIGARMQADQHGMRSYSVDYRMPPDYPYPAALDDCMATYRHVLASHAASKIVITGRSAGGNLAAAMLLRARDENLPMPAALVLLSPEVDLTESGDSFEVNRMVDLVLPGSLMQANRLYAAEADLRHPYLSPLFGDLAGFPATFLQAGTRDLFLSNTVRMHRALLSAGVAADLHVFEAMPHGGFMGSTPEDRELLAAIGSFIRKNLDTGG